MRTKLGHGSVPRVSKKTRDAIELMVFSGLSVDEAAEKVPMHPRALRQALKRPHVIALHGELIRHRLSGEAGKSIGTLAELRDTAASEYVRADCAVKILDRGGVRPIGDPHQPGAGAGISLNILIAPQHRGGLPEGRTIDGEAVRLSIDTTEAVEP